jgi:hypothetical protein
MGILDFLGFRTGHGDHFLIVATYEGPRRMRLNGNRTRGKGAKKRAVDHDRTVFWIELSRDGARLDQGIGPAAGKLPAGEAEKLLRDLPLSPACRSVIQALEQGHQLTSKIVGLEQWGHFGVGHDEPSGRDGAHGPPGPG